MVQNEYKYCPYCAETIKAGTIRCKHCQSYLDEERNVIKESMTRKTTEELIDIWTDNDREEWTDDAFEAIGMVLMERNMTLPEQKQVRSFGYNISYAGFGKRALAHLIDSTILMAISLLISQVFPAPSQFNGLLGAIGFYELLILFITPGAIFYLTSLSFWGIIITWLYYALMESSSAQATLGKMVMQIKVTDNRNKRIGFGRATGRFFGMYLSSFILFIGFFMVLFTQRKQGLHDLMADCLVVNK